MTMTVVAEEMNLPAHGIMMMTAETLADKAEADGLVILKVTLKHQNADGKVAVVEVRAEAAMMMMIVVVPAVVEVVHAMMVMDADGSEIMKDTLKHQNVDGKTVVAEVAAEMKDQVIHAAVAVDVIVMMTATHVAAVAHVMTATDVDGLEIMKDIQKLLNADGKAVAVAADVLQEAVMMTMMIVAVHAIHAVAAVVAAVVDMAAGSEILKDTPKQLSVAGATDKRLIVASCLERRMKFILLSFL
jgi:hypothetical protein